MHLKSFIPGLFMVIALLLLCLRGSAREDTLRVVFYNTENLYDPFNDTLKMDEDFLPGEPRAWNYGKFKTKIVNLARALIAAGRWNPPALIGLCEIENRFVLKKLLEETPLQQFGYQIIHEESPDPRGVDVALFYLPDYFRVIRHRVIRMRSPADTSFRTRDILYVTGILPSNDTLHVFVNHWPSKFGGIAGSLQKRIQVAKKLRSVLDSLVSFQHDPKILLMGDFNDTPDQEAITDVLGAGYDSTQTDNCLLFNLMLPGRGNTGTHKFHGEWSTIDQFMISHNLLKGKISISSEGPVIIRNDFLLDEDESYSGHKPFRTYSGPRYLGGYSDHLPVVIDLIYRP